MNPRICVCCGEPMRAEGSSLSRNPNVCACCSSMLDGMEDIRVPKTEPIPPRSVKPPPEVEAVDAFVGVGFE